MSKGFSALLNRYNPSECSDQFLLLICSVFPLIDSEDIQSLLCCDAGKLLVFIMVCLCVNI